MPGVRLGENNYYPSLSVWSRMRGEPENKGQRLLVASAKKLGANEARLIRARDIVVDKRVRLKCAIPLCVDYGRHLLCPPNLMSVEEFSGILKLYSRALIVQVEADTDSSDKSSRPLDHELCKKIESSTRALTWERKLHKLINQLEAIAFKNGFYFAAGLIGGNCCLCRECVGPERGELCKHPFSARPSMEAMGIDVVRTCRNVGLPLDLSSDKNVRWTGLVLLD